MRAIVSVFLGTSLFLAAFTANLIAETQPSAVRDRTMVIWAQLAELQQRNVGLFVVQNGPAVFDGLIYSELRPRTWMVGSDFFRRTQKDQATYPTEEAAGALHMLAVVTRGREVELYRDGQLVTRYQIEGDPLSLTKKSEILFGVHHLELLGSSKFKGEIEDARIYDRALTADQLASLKPNVASQPAPWGWWTFETGTNDAKGTFPAGVLSGRAEIIGGRLRLRGGFMSIGLDPSTIRTRETELWPRYHVTALPEEGLCRPYDANGCLYWNGRYHLMYIFQDPDRPKGGHSWGHASSTDLVNWTFHPPSLTPNPGDPDVGIFSGNAFLNKAGVPMLCWFGVDAGVCVATAKDQDLIRWQKHPQNPIIPVPKAGDPNFGKYHVWDPYLWLEGENYYCLLGGNRLPNGEDTLYLMRSKDLVNWVPVHPFYEANPSWTVRGEDCSCPDFFRLGNRHVLMSISHNVGGRCYIGRMEQERFIPEQHVRMNWPGGNFFAPESLEDPQRRRIFWAWVTDPRSMATQAMTGSGVQSLPRILSLDAAGDVGIKPVPELQALRGKHTPLSEILLPDGALQTLPGIAGNALEISLEIEPDAGGKLAPVLVGGTRELIVKVLCSPDGTEETTLVYDTVAQVLKLDCSRSTLRQDVSYLFHPLDSGGFSQKRPPGEPHPRPVVEAPLVLKGDEPLRLQIFLDQSMLEVFANGRQCLTQQVFPARADSRLIRLQSRGGSSRLVRGDVWEMHDARWINHKHVTSQP